jgi:transcription termination/antitermination protein NusG
MAPYDAQTREWFAVQVWSGRENISARHLRQRGYEVFLPCYREQRLWSDRIKSVERALFAGYVFCRAQPEVVGKIITTPGVIRVVGDDRGPLSIPACEIEAIQQIVATRLSMEPSPVPHAGQRVRMELGPLRGVEGVVLEMKNHHRLVVSIPLLQRAVAVEVDSEWISIQHAVFTE